MINHWSSFFRSIGYRSKQLVSPNVARKGLILGLLLFAFALRLYKVTSVPLSRDEVITIGRYVSLPVIDILTTHHSNNHPLASLLAHLFSPQADHLFMMRWPSILVGMIALPFVYRLGIGLFGRWVGILALFLVSITPVYIGYSVIVRGYGGLITMSAISLYFLWRALRRNRWPDWFGFAVVNLLALFFHLFSLLAVAMTLALVAIGLLWVMSKQGQVASLAKGQLKPLLLKFGLVSLVLLAVYVPLIYARTSLVLSEGGYAGDFEVWRDGLAWPEDLLPFKIFIGLMAPLSTGDVAAYLYLIFWLIGLVSLWRRQPSLAVAVVIWFLTPFVFIFVGMQILGTGFYAYVRFLLYMLPAYVLLVALGLVTFIDGLSSLARKRGGQVAGQVVKWAAIAGLFGLIAVSINWYIIRATNTDWLALARTLSGRIQAQDIAICEEYQRGLELPDRAKPYCTWMLETFTELEGYTPGFQSTTDFVADYDHLRQQKAMMLAPGGVWLVLWHKIVFNVEHLITDEKPLVITFPSSDFFPYQSWGFGSSTLVHVNSEETLFGNLYKAVEILLQLEQSSAARARYYRSLAEMEAIQGHKLKAEQYLEKSRAMVELTGGMYPDMFLGETQQAIERIPDNHPPPETAHRVGYQFGPSLCLSAYEVSPALLEVGQPVALTLYWQALDFVEQDYAFFLQFEGQASPIQHRLGFDPFDRVYPTPWWWSGQQLVEQREFIVPPDMPAQDYLVQLGAYDRHSETELVKPLFFMSYQSAETGLAHWRIEAVANPAPDCP